MNTTGIDQVTSASKAISPDEWDVILTSPLDRARHTARIIGDQLGFDQIHELDLLIERSFGEAEGMSYEQWKSKYSDLDEIPGGESKSDLVARSEKLLETIANTYTGKRVLAVSHGALIRTVLSIASNERLPRDGERLGNASLNVVSHLENRWTVTKYELGPLSS